MSDEETEIPFAGGNSNESVVRVGDTVRRAQGDHSATVHRLLNHLEFNNYPASPRFLGIDAKNREIISYLPGDTAFPPDLWTDTRALTTAARLLRQYHDLTETFPKSDADRWAFPDPNRARHQVICHNDFAPYNMVFNDGIPTGVFDFDAAGPGTPLRDVAYLAYWMVPLSFGSEDLTEHSLRDVENGSPRLKLLCETYGIACDMALLDMVDEVMCQMGDPALVGSVVGPAAVERLQADGHFDHWAREKGAFPNYRDRLAANLS